MSKWGFFRIGCFLNLLIMILGGCSEKSVVCQENEMEHNEHVPCRIVVDWNAQADSRVELTEENGVLKSTWVDGDGLTVKNLADNKLYTFMLVEGAGTSRGVFESEETPVDGGCDYVVYYPHVLTSDSKFDRYYSLKPSWQKNDDKYFLMQRYLTMRHRVGHYTDIRFIPSDYVTSVEIDGKMEYRETKADNLQKTTYMRVNAQNIPVDFTPTKLKLEVFNSDNVTFWDTNGNVSSTSNPNEMIVEMYNFVEGNSFEVTFPLSYKDIVLPAGSSLRATFTSRDGWVCYAEKHFDKHTVMSGGKLLILNYKEGWTAYDETPDYYSSDFSQDGNVVALQETGGENGINIVLMGDGYSDRQVADGTYDAVMRECYEAFFAKEPYKSFKDFFNVYYVVAVSAYEGCLETASEENPNNSVFQTYHGVGTHVEGNDDKTLEYARKVPSLADKNESELTSIVIMNSKIQAGTAFLYSPKNEFRNTDYGMGYAVAYFPKGEGAERLIYIINHEACGHAFGKLGDEYSTGEKDSKTAEKLKNNWHPLGRYMNIDIESIPENTVWSEFCFGDYLTIEGIGAYEGALTHAEGFYRPTKTSIMVGSSSRYFNAPSRKAIYVRIHKMYYGDSWNWEEHKDEFFEWDKKNIMESGGSSANTRGVWELMEPELHTSPVVYDEPLGK